jgi:hypothetical protein
MFKSPEDPTGGALLSGILLAAGVVGMMFMGLLDIWF